ncbi:serine hydrolase domain-containing protein [uncultured Parasphingorhabdus sp.]|uniref:serine hydrolase domain-containing protein n=1 Tax=uncultured Parasphingorhabdus sp. TaxID=2709694 RepID=UPI002AA65FBB|nr:serine hydrolase domain-containing protein [uncultured Parasphingorhabdus sp.]
MKRSLALLFGLAALLLVSWNGYRALVEQRAGFPLPLLAQQVAQEKLPVAADDWHGKIDYRGLDRDFTVLAARPEMAGLAVAIVEDGELRFVGTYGVVDRESGDRVMPDTVFRWASVSKGVAGVLAAQLAEEGGLNLQAPLSSWHSSLRLPGNAETQINLAQLLSHRTGLTKNAYDSKLEDGEDPGMLRRQLVDAPLQCVPGSCHSYQNIAFDAASEILGQAAGTLYSDAVQKRLFEPLGMTSAQFGMSGLTGAKSWARPHRGDQVRTLSESYWRVPAAAGVSSNIVDMARWMRAQMGENSDVLSGTALTLAHAPLVRTHRVYRGDLARALKDPHYGLGWRSFTYSDRQLVGHSGAVDGFRSTMIFDPAARTGVVAMWNSSWGRPFSLPFAVLDSFYGQSGNSWLDLSDLPAPDVPPPAS